MSYAYITYKTEEDILNTYSEDQLIKRQEFLDSIKGDSDELIYEPADVRPDDPGVLTRQIGDVALGDFAEAFVKFLKSIAQIFFTIDPLDLVPLAVDLMDHYMFIHAGERQPFDTTSGRSSTDYMNRIRAREDVKEILHNEGFENDEIAKFCPTPEQVVFDKIHGCIKTNKLTPDRIFQVDMETQRYLNYREDVPVHFDPEKDVEAVTYRIVADANGKFFRTDVSRDLDFNLETFPAFLNELIEYAKPTPQKPILVLIVRTIKSFTLNLLDMCEKNGIILCAFPFWAKHLEPLSQFVLPTIHLKFKEEYVRKYKGISKVCSPIEATELMKTIIERVQGESVERTKRDFRKCLQLRKCLTFSDDAESLKMEAQEECVQVSEENIAGYDYEGSALNAKLKKAKRKKRTLENPGELNELMFAQIGPLRVEDYY